MTHGIGIRGERHNLRMMRFFTGVNLQHRCMSVHDRHLIAMKINDQDHHFLVDKRQDNRTCRSIRIKSYLFVSAAVTASRPLVATSTAVYPNLARI